MGWSVRLLIFLLAANPDQLHALNGPREPENRAEWKSLSHRAASAAQLFKLNDVTSVRAGLPTRRPRRRLEQTSPSKSTVDSEGVTCSLTDAQITRYFDGPSRTWMIDGDVWSALESDLQSVVNCSSTNDVILFTTTQELRPKKRVILPWNLTLSSYVERLPNEGELFPSAQRRTIFTCPTDREGVFLVRAAGVVLANLEFAECHLTNKKAPTAVVEVAADDCADAATGISGKLQLVRVRFVQNLLRGSVVLSMASTSCTALEMRHVHFLDNDCNTVCGARLSVENDLSDVVLEGNVMSDKNYAPVMLRAPPGSTTRVRRLTARSNQGNLLRVRDARLEIADSTFSRNDRGETYTSNRKAPPPDSVPHSACIDGNGATLIVDGCHFEKNSGIYGQAVFATLSNVTLTDSSLDGNTGSNGGGLWLNASRVVLRAVSMSKNAAEEGGAGRVINSELEIRNSSFAKNSADREGGVFTVENTSVRGNDLSFSNNNARHGGCLRLSDGSTFALTQGTFVDNRADLGGVFDLEGEVEGRVDDSTFKGNAAKDGSVLHGHMDSRFSAGRCRFDGNSGPALDAMRRTSVVIEDSNFTGTNETGAPGGMVKCTSSSNFTAQNTSFSDSSAQSGGVLALFHSSAGKLIDCSFDRNSAEAEGGVGFVGGQSSISVRGGEVRLSSASRGAGLYVAQDSVAEIEGSKFIENFARQTGGAIHAAQSHVTVHDTAFLKNGAGKHGGAIYALESEVLLAKASVCKNAAQLSGGGISTTSAKDVHIEESVFLNNSAWEGAAVALANGTTGRILDSKFENGTADGDRSAGGAVFVLRSNLAAERARTSNNRAETGGDLAVRSARVEILNSFLEGSFAQSSGGAIHEKADGNAARSDIFLRDVEIASTGAKREGGGISVQSATVRASNLRIRGCHARRGGGLWADGAARVICSECLLENNAADDEGGGCAIQSQTPQGLAYQFEDCTFHRNSAQRGAGLHVTTQASPVSCEASDEGCTYVVLVGTTSTSNRAEVAGGAALATDLDVLRVDCAESEEDDDLKFLSAEAFERLAVLNRLERVCPSWKNNPAQAYGDDIGSVAALLEKWLCDSHTDERIPIEGDNYTIADHESGALTLGICLEVTDSLGQGPVASTNESAVEAAMSSPDGLFAGELRLTLEGGRGNFSGVAGYVPPETYRVEIHFSALRPSTLTLFVEIRACRIGEFIAANGSYCQPCSGDAFNFFPEEKEKTCDPCPKNGRCDSSAIRPAAGYWHAAPCSVRLQNCLTSEACDAEGRDGLLREMTDGLENCSFTDGFVQIYQEAQCRSGYVGPLCGACDEGYGRSRSLRCEKCFVGWSNYCLILVSILILLCISGFTVRSSTKTKHRIRSTRKRRIRHFFTSWLSDGGNPDLPSAEAETQRESSETTEAEQPPARDGQDEEDARENGRMVDSAREIELAQWKAAEILKITMNYLQVLNIALSLNVSWTDALVALFSIGEFIGGVTTAATVRSVDCLVSEDSDVPRSVTVTIVALLVPLTAWFIYVVLWAVLAVLHAETLTYFIRRCVLSFLVVSYVAYISITKTVVNILSCVRVFDEAVFQSTRARDYWAVDTSLLCYERHHARLAWTLGWPILVLFCLFFPLTAATLLILRRRKRTLKTRNLFETAGFLYRSYENRYIFWESIVMLRKAMLASVVVFAYPLGGNLQGILCVAILITAMHFQSLCSPYREEFAELNAYESTALAVTTLTFVTGLVFNDDRTSEAARRLLTALVFLANIPLFSFLVYKFVRSCRSILESFLEFNGFVDGRSGSHRVAAAAVLYAMMTIGRTPASAQSAANNGRSESQEKFVEMT